MADEQKGIDRAGLDDKGIDRAALDDKGIDRSAQDIVQSILTTASGLGGYLVVAFVAPVPAVANGAPAPAADTRARVANIPNRVAGRTSRKS